MSLIARSNSVKLSVLPMLIITEVECNHYQNLNIIFFKLNNLILKFIWKDKGQEIAKTFLKNRVRVTKSLKTPGYCGKRKQTKHVYKKLQECTFSSSSG